MVPIVIGVLGTVFKGTGGLENKKTNGDSPNFSIVKISQNTKKSPGDLKRFAVTGLQ